MAGKAVDAQQVEEKVKAVIAEQLHVNLNEVSNDSSFIEDLGADSLDIVELVMAMEEHFNLEIPDDEAENIQTVQHAINYIKNQLIGDAD